MQRENKWQDRFDGRFSEEWWHGFGTTPDIDKMGISGIKSFIQSEIDRAVAEERDLIVKKIERRFGKAKLHKTRFLRTNEEIVRDNIINLIK